MTTKQRAFLRSMANTMDPILHVGKDGINDHLVQQAADALEARELIKGTVLQNAPLTAREVCDILCQSIQAEGVQVIGNRFVLYKKAKKNSKIDLSQI
ncbi:MAG: ribosome assembly RNA-binding protein YhbY [Clostridia bacterium]|nr:ribosome assembly RNA-binding protein YhbY [Clostridia bacterium]